MTNDRIAHFNGGSRTDAKDDKGNYYIRERENWHALHSVESKTMIAIFTLEKRG